MLVKPDFRVLGFLLLAAGVVFGQSLADIARAEREKKAQKAQQGTTATKVFGDDDLHNANVSPDGTTPECNELAALDTLRKVSYAESTYTLQFPRGYSKSLSVLGPARGKEAWGAEHAGLLDASMAKGDTFEMAGYRFTYTPGSVDSRGFVGTFAFSARPLRYGQTGKTSYSVDGTLGRGNKFRATTQERPTASYDPAPATPRGCVKAPGR